jgi:hypothetical protein
VKTIVTPKALKTALQQKFTKKDVIRLIRDDLTNRGLKPVEIERRLPFLVSKMGPLIEGDGQAGGRRYAGSGRSDAQRDGGTSVVHTYSFP